MSQYGAPIGGKPPGGPVPPRGYYSPYPPSRRRFGLWFIIFVLFGLLVLSTLSNMGHYLDSMSSSGGTGMGSPRLEEIQVENNGANDKILVADVTGLISSLALERSGVNMVHWIDEQLKQAADDFQIKAVILKVDSPGGEVLASDQIYETILKFQEETGKPVIASMAGLAASGGYYVSAPCRWIVAHPLTITGSIGVIMHGYNYRNLMAKVGVEPTVFKSGRFKDMLSGEKFPDDVSPEEKAMVQEMVDTTFNRFKQVIQEGRDWAQSQDGDSGKPLASNWQNFADGRILSGEQAFELGLVDELGGFEKAVARAKSLAGIAEANLIAYDKPFSFSSFFRFLGKAESNQKIEVDLGFDRPKLQAGRLYLLSPTYIQ
ncbi:MAG: signal peptide peptidase SppA [Verrucomicrobia bacterium]|nr:signal peptide peptidase SppA [Verrucomicrobiota bacterium]